MPPTTTCNTIERICFLLFLCLLLLLSLCATLHGVRAQFVEFYADYKKNHIEDEVNYRYHYYIDDAPSKVHLSHREERRGTQVTGQYALLEPGGHVRSVHYEVDGDKGFRSVVHTRTANSRIHQLVQLRNKQPQVPIAHAQPVAFVV